MDPGRVKAYLQVACTGLGFDIGEIWWATDDNGSSSRLTSMEPGNNGNGSDGKSLEFVQLYTSKSYENRRQMLVRPEEEENESETALVTANNHSRPKRNESEKHVLSPLLVDAISKTAQVVWAHTKKQEGLIGRSDVRLQTAVGMPVAVDGNGNMCVVVMFSPNMIQSSDDALEYLQSISKGATSTSIPALLPAFDPKQGLISLPHHHKNNQMIPLLSDPAMTNGVTTRFVSLDEKASEVLSLPEVQSTRDLSSAPKDCFGIPMLPDASEIDGTTNNSAKESAVSDVFDEASYGVWSTIMDTPENPVRNGAQPFGNGANVEDEDAGPVYTINKPDMPAARQERLEEFAAAFLEVSVFDIAEVWIPVGEESDYLGQVTSVSSTDSNPILNQFVTSTEKIMVKSWSGAVGRAYSTGNPVWNADRNTFADAGRKIFFNQVRLETALAVPVFHGKASKPSFVFACYAFVRSETVPFVLKFVQQALGLLWKGLDQIQPHEAIEGRLWQDVEPADLGEMAADIEMHQHFLQKKRPYEDVNDSGPNGISSEMGFGSSSGAAQVNSIYTGESSASPTMEPIEVSYQSQASAAPPPLQFQAFQMNIQNPNSHGGMGQSNQQQHNFQDIFSIDRSAKRARSMSSQGIQIQPLMNSPRQGDTTPCRIKGCSDPAVTRKPYCARHVGNRMCEHPTCGKCAQGATRFCIAHGGGRRCKFPGCDKGARDKNFCAAHGGGKRCKFDGCSKSAVGGSSLCTAHGGGRRCSIAGCNKSAQSSTKFCVKHGGGKKCIFTGCQKVARGRTEFCAAHGGGVRCKLEGCTRVAIGKSQLCRAHGGGNHSRSGKGDRDESPPPPMGGRMGMQFT
ncbi:MAG: hypothetical protein SGBAC_000335 [Bacillariaceae sp.]